MNSSIVQHSKKIKFCFYNCSHFSLNLKEKNIGFNVNVYKKHNDILKSINKNFEDVYYVYFLIKIIFQTKTLFTLFLVFELREKKGKLIIQNRATFKFVFSRVLPSKVCFERSFNK